MFWKWNKLLSFAKQQCSNNYAETHFPRIKNPEDLATSVETNDCLKKILQNPNVNFAPLFETQEEGEPEETETKKKVGSNTPSKVKVKDKSMTFSAFALSCVEMLWTTISRSRYQQIANDYRDLVHLATATQEEKGKQTKENQMPLSLQKQIDNHNSTVSGYQLMTPSPSKLRVFKKNLLAFLDQRNKSNKKQENGKKEHKQAQHADENKEKRKVQQIHELWADLASSFDSRILKYIEGLAIKSGNALWNAQQSPKFSKENLCLAEYQAMKQTLLGFRKHFALQQKQVKNLSSSPPFKICLLTDSFNRCVGAQFGEGEKSLFLETVSSPILPYFNNVNIDFLKNPKNDPSQLVFSQKQQSKKEEKSHLGNHRSQETIGAKPKFAKKPKEHAKTQAPSQALSTLYPLRHKASPSSSTQVFRGEDSLGFTSNFIRCGEPKVCKKSWNAFQKLLEKITKTELQEKHQNQNQNQNPHGRKFVLLSY